MTLQTIAWICAYCTRSHGGAAEARKFCQPTAVTHGAATTSVDSELSTFCVSGLHAASAAGAIVETTWEEVDSHAGHR